MTTREAAKFIGKIVDIPYGACIFQAKVMEIRDIGIGEYRILCKPVSGSGCVWEPLTVRIQTEAWLDDFHQAEDIVAQALNS